MNIYIFVEGIYSLRENINNSLFDLSISTLFNQQIEKQKIQLSTTTMHTDPTEFTNRQQITLSDQQAEQLYKKVSAFENQLQHMQSQFKHSNDEKVYYIVSTKFISEWKLYCHSTEKMRLQPHVMNGELYEEGKLKKGLQQGADFEILNEEIYQLFQPFNDPTQLNKRQAVFIGDQKRVPIYLSTYKYLLTTFDILKSIDFNRTYLQDLKLNSIQTSESSTLQHLLQLVKEQQKLSDDINLRLWLPEKELTLEKLYQLIRKELKPCSVPTYKVQGVGKRLENIQAKIEQVFTEDCTYFVVESKKQDQRFIFIKDNQGRCQGCNHFGVLDFPCGCQKVKYCSQRCLQKDKGYHIKSCPYAEQQQLNKKISMTKQPNSRNGLVGLNNLGNTCFMNSCLQCMSHTMPLTNYFLNEYFEAEINKTNKIGFKGKLAKNYAKFIKAMWCDDENTFAPYSVKNAVSDINPMFSGYAQHDSQQFFSFLADGLHEDLNRIQQKAYVPSVQEQNKSEVEFARQSWIAHLKRNQSIVTDLMTGQYRSIVTCPDCNHQSTTFDPFTTVSLTIPQTTENVTDFFLIHGNMEKKTQRGWFKYSKNDPVEWNKRACQAVGADPQRCCLYVVSMKENIYKVGKSSMAEVAHKIESEGKNMFLIQLSDEDMAIPRQNLIEFPLRLSKAAYYRTQQLFFKIPIFFDKQLLTGRTVYQRILKFLYAEAYTKGKNKKSFMGWGNNYKQYDQYLKEMLKTRPFKCFLRLDKKLDRSYNRTEVQFKKQIELEDSSEILEIIKSHNLNPAQCELDARFQRLKTDDFAFEKLKDFDTVGKQPKVQKQNSQMQLERCLQTFSSPQILQAGNEWYCPKCKQHKLAKKQLSIYRAPKVLILHLKRFKQKGTFRKQKNETLIEFPSELDLQPYLIDLKPMQAYKQQIDEQVYIKSKAQNIPFIMSNTNSKPIYELYAISNHYGGLGGGHYTAYAKNNGQWHEFDDSRVSGSPRKDIVSSSAYILFYERKD